MEVFVFSGVGHQHTICHLYFFPSLLLFYLLVVYGLATPRQMRIIMQGFGRRKMTMNLFFKLQPLSNSASDPRANKIICAPVTSTNMPA